MPDVLCTICARGGSKGVKGKNFRMLAEKPLIAHSISQARESGLFRNIVVSTDSVAIQDIAIKYGAEVFFDRPRELSTDEAPKIPVIRHAFLASEKYFGLKFDYLVDLDATSPLRSVDDILGAYALLVEKGLEIVITGTPARRSPYFNLIELDAEGCPILSKQLSRPVGRRQEAPPCYDMNASIYVWNRDGILNHEGLFTQRTGLFIMPEERSIDIDSELDFQIVEYLLMKRAGK